MAVVHGIEATSSSSHEDARSRPSIKNVTTQSVLCLEVVLVLVLGLVRHHLLHYYVITAKELRDLAVPLDVGDCDLRLRGALPLVRGGPGCPSGCCPFSPRRYSLLRQSGVKPSVCMVYMNQPELTIVWRPYRLDTGFHIRDLQGSWFLLGTVVL